MATSEASARLRPRFAAVSLLWPEIRQNIRRLQAMEDAPLDRVIDMQLGKLNALLHHFRTVSPVYQDLSDRGASDWTLRSLSDLRRFPVATKETLRSYEPFLASRNDAFRRGSTSGSTGQNFWFWQSLSMARARTAAVWYCYDRVGVDYFADCKVRVWGGIGEGTFGSRVRASLKEKLVNFRTLPSYPLDKRIARAHLRVIEAVAPKLLEGYPSTLARLARIALGDGVFARHRPGALVTSGEQLTQEQRRLITQHFGDPLFDRYGSREFGVIAHQRPGVDGWWVPPTRFIIEETAEGELLVTDLDNYAFPFIRYAIGDRGRVESEFAGIQVIAELSGRSHDEIRTPRGGVLSGQFWVRLAKAVPGIAEFQVVQTGRALVELRVVPTADFSAESRLGLQNRFRSACGNEMELVIRSMTELPASPAGKRRFIIGLQES